VVGKTLSDDESRQERDIHMKTATEPEQPAPERSQDEPLLTREQLRLKLNEQGYPLTASYFNKISLPSVNAGPPVAKWWGKRPLYRLDDALAWVERRCGSAPGRLIAPISSHVA
jgi:hypothetical protein